MKQSTNHQYFVRQLLQWNQKHNTREMPWKGEKDPYKIWLSEIILQQTRVEQGLDYYNNFIKTFPTIKHLAKASDTKVFKLWEGLGYYTRCKNLLTTARYIAEELDGKFPAAYDDILALKGVGPYTAAAIGSFAFDIPKAVVDGNVFRVLSRYFGIDRPIDSNEGKRIFSDLADELLDKNKPGVYNQALMDFGAVVCKPQLPQCRICPLKKKCFAVLNDAVAALPVKEKSIVKKARWFYYIMAEYKGKWYVKKRGSGDIWENLYEFILVESDVALTADQLMKKKPLKEIVSKGNAVTETISGIYKQQLTHQTLAGQFITLRLRNKIGLPGFEQASTKALQELPFPKFITSYLKDKTVSLNLF